MGSVMALRERSLIDEVVGLADGYADALISALPAVVSDEMMHQVVAGTLLSFLTEALTKVQIDERHDR
jgi:hypothetical protein